MFAVIMAGGSGTRFWPRSRKRKPKQLIKLCGDNTMIFETVSRVLGIIPNENIFVVTNSLQSEALKNEIPDVPTDNILVEPLGRNTAPCIGLAAVYLMKKNADAVMAVLPADHIIEKRKRFLNILSAAEKFLEKNDALITLGIPPASPHTGYGYIKSGEKVNESDNTSFFKVDRFAEKPNKETAESFLKDGGYYWNSGTFIWKASYILEMIKLYIPDLYTSLMDFEKSIGTDKEEAALEYLYKNIDPVSIDIGIMERSENTVMIEADIGWSDVGSWSAMDELYKKGENGNISVGKHAFYESNGCTVFSPNKTVAVLGLDDIVVVETDDALLVCNKKHTEHVKKITEILKEKGMDELL